MALIQYKDGYTFKDVTEKAKEVFNTGLFELYRVNKEEETEALIETIEDLNEALEKGCTIAIEVGYINKEN
jgi:hypothetical protein